MALLLEGWQYKAAFVIQFKPETDVESGRFTGRIEHVPSSRAIRFQSLEQVLAFIADMLAEIRRKEETGGTAR